jgi:hypothetical protein
VPRTSPFGITLNSGGAERARGPRGKIYVTVSRRRESQNRAPRGRGALPMMSSGPVWAPPRQIVCKWRKRFAKARLPALDDQPRGWSSRAFPPSIVLQIKALACKLPHRLGLPRSRMSLADIRQEVTAQGIVAHVSGTTLWHWLSTHALRPGQNRNLIFPRDPDFAQKAGRVLDLYARLWAGEPLPPSEFVISADEKTSIQARRRKQPTLPSAAGRIMRVEHEYFSPRCSELLGSLGRPSGQALRALRRENRDCSDPAPNRPGHEPRTVSIRSARVLDHGQLLGSSWSKSRATDSVPLAQRHPGTHPNSCQLAQSN